jgi:hypothetical protein
MGKLNAGMKLGDIVLQATGRQLNRLGSKLGMDKDILKGMSENQVKGAILDESQKYMRNKRRNTNRRVGAAAVTGAAAYGVADFLHDMLGISSVGDGTLSASERAKTNNKKPKTLPKSKPKKKPMPLPKPKPKKYNLKAGGKGTAAQRLKEIEKNKVLDKVKKAAAKGKGK